MLWDKPPFGIGWLVGLTLSRPGFFGLPQAGGGGTNHLSKICSDDAVVMKLGTHIPYPNPRSIKACLKKKKKSADVIILGVRIFFFFFFFQKMKGN